MYIHSSKALKNSVSRNVHCRGFALLFSQSCECISAFSATLFQSKYHLDEYLKSYARDASEHVYRPSCKKRSLFGPMLNKNEKYLRNSSNTVRYQVSRKFVQLFSSCHIRIDRQTDTATFISVVCNFSLQRRQKKINAVHAESLTASSGRNSFAAL